MYVTFCGIDFLWEKRGLHFTFTSTIYSALIIKKVIFSLYFFNAFFLIFQISMWDCFFSPKNTL